jgi:hypothetical protein
MRLSQIFGNFTGKYFDDAITIVTGNLADLIWSEVEKIDLIGDW